MTLGESFRFSFGGAEANATIAAARLGATARFISRVGNDAIGDAIRRGLQSEGIDTRLAVDEGRTTGVMVKERVTAFRQRVTYWRSGSPASALTADDVTNDDLADAKCLLVTGVTLALSPDMPAHVERLFHRARSAGTVIALDLNYRSRLWSVEAARAAYRRIAPMADLLFAGVEEARIVDDRARDRRSAVAVLEGLGGEAWVATAGADGAAAGAGADRVERDALSVPVVDTVGAGDAFVGAFLADWLAGQPLDRCLETAVAAGAHTCMSEGDWEGSPSRSDLEHVLDYGVER